MSTNHNNNEYRKFAESTKPLANSLVILDRITQLYNLFVEEVGVHPEYLEIGKDEYRELYEAKCSGLEDLDLRPAEVVFSGYMVAAGANKVLIGNWPNFNLFHAQKRYSPTGFQKSIKASVSCLKTKDE